MILKIVIITLLAILFYCLASAAYFMLKDGSAKGEQMVKALMWRIILALVIFFLLLIGFYFGWITPNPGPFMLT